MAVSDTLIGTLFDGRYQVVRKLGAGGMANVYLAEDQELGRRVAIKILNDRHANDDQFVERFRREAKNAAALSHPNIVSIYDRGEAEGTYYIAMEFLDGRTLKELVVSRGPAPITVSVEYARQILQALRFAHRHGIVHRDIKPHNVLVDAEGRVKVTDFGIARAGTSQMTEAGSIVGTAQYLSPEQARGTDVDQRSDVYSLGIVLYELLTGTVPFNGDTPVEIAMKHLSAVPEPPSTRRPDVPRDLDLIVMRALAKDPADRYQSAEEMDADLERFARGAAVSPVTEESATQIMRLPDEPYAATAATMISPGRRTAQLPPPPPPVYYDLEEPIHRRPMWPWVAALLFVLGAGIGGWFLYSEISNKLNSTKPVAVELYLNMPEAQARVKIKADGFQPLVDHHSSRTTPRGLVFKQVPAAGEHLPKGSQVHIWVSTGLPKAGVPDLVGQQSTDAVATLTRLAPEARPAQRPVGEARRRGDGAGAEGRREAHGREPRAAQRVEGAAAGGRAVGGRRAVRPGRLRAPGEGLQGAAALRRRQPAGEHRDRPEPERGRDGGQELRHLAHRLEGAEDLDGAGRDELRPRLGGAAAPGVRLQVAGDRAGRDPTRTRSAPCSPRTRPAARRRRRRPSCT